MEKLKCKSIPGIPIANRQSPTSLAAFRDQTSCARGRFEISADGVVRMDILAIRDDGNDPLRPTIANACEWIEQARLDGGKVLVHCVSPPLVFTNQPHPVGGRRSE